MKTIDVLKQSLWNQFGASIDMLRNAIVMWPDDKWETHSKVFYMAHHTLFFLDYYLTNPPSGFEPRFASVEDDTPDKIYSKQDLIDYLSDCRTKCQHVIDNITDENIEERWTEEQRNRSFVMIELLMYNMRHVQHHAAQINMMLRNEIDNAPRWDSRALKES